MALVSTPVEADCVAWDQMVDLRAVLYAVDPEVFCAIENERRRQASGIELIASENYVSPAVLAAQGSVLTNKYAEGYPGKRYYGGCQFVDDVEQLAIERARQIFHAEHANVQPHSGTQANLAVYQALLQPGDTVLAMKLDHGGHLSHGLRQNASGRLYNFVHYGVRQDTEYIDYDQVADLAHAHRPKLVVAGGSAYPRTIDFSLFRQIADSVGAKLMVDMAHIAGLVAVGSASQSGTLCRRGHFDHAQDLAWPSRRSDSQQGRAGPRYRPGRLPRYPGRSTHARHCGQGRGLP